MWWQSCCNFQIERNNRKRYTLGIKGKDASREIARRLFCYPARQGGLEGEMKQEKGNATWYVEFFWWARVDVASRASKKAPQGLFCPPDYSAGRCCSNPPLRVKLEIPDKTKNQRIFYAGLIGGAKQPKSEPLPSGASLTAISSKVMVFVPSL